MLHFGQIEEIVHNVKYLDWQIALRLDALSTYLPGTAPPGQPGRPYLQVFGHGPDPKNNMEDAKWSSRKWWLSYHMCKNEIIRTALKAIEAAVAHEMYENILYKGHAVFTPHMDYDEIVRMMEDHSVVDSREDGMQGE